MVLSDCDILKEIKRSNIILKPFHRKFIQPASVDLHLNNDFLVFDTHKIVCIDVKKPVEKMMKRITIKGDDPFILHPKEFALASILEETGVSDKLVARLEGKSSLGRLGLIVHTTAGYLDPGNSLNMTLELFNAGQLPILLYYKMPVAQMAFEYLSSPCDRPYGSAGLNSKYKGNRKTTASRMCRNFNNS